MKMLIVDNEPRRYRRLKEEILKINSINEEDISIVSNIVHAMDEVDEVLFDIVLLDILIPYTNVDEDDKQNCIDFLEFLHTHSSNRPRRIIGITSDSTLIKEMENIFSHRAWVVFEYSDSNDEWLKKTLACVKYASDGKSSKPQVDQPVDILIICALLNVELNEILALPFNWEKNPVLTDDNVFIYYGSLEVNRKNYRIAATYALRMGMVATAILCSRLLPLLQPSLVAMTGICAGNKDEVKLGDVIVADSSWNYQSGKLHKDKLSGEIKLKIKPHHLTITDKIKNFFIQLSRNQELLSNLTYQDSRGEIVPTQIKVGSLVSGASVIADDITIASIKEQQDKNIFGIEMEIYGLYDACASSSYTPLFFALKGVCDYADSEKNDDMQSIAARNSALVLKHFIEDYIHQVI